MQYRSFTITAVTVMIAAMFNVNVSVAHAEEAGAAHPRMAVKPLAHIEASELRDVLALLDVRYVVKSEMNVIVLKGSNEAIEAALRAIETLDVPAPRLELTLFVVSASKQHDEIREIPPSLAPAIDQLRGVFSYRGFELLDVASLKVLAGRRGYIEGGVNLGADGLGRYQISFSNVRVVPGEKPGGWRFHLNDLNFNLSSNKVKPMVQIRTEVVVREGQKAVIGRSTPQGGDENLVLIVDVRFDRDPDGRHPQESSES